MSDKDRCFVDTDVWLYAFIVGQASFLRGQYAVSYWDSTILACALQANARVLYTEDFQDGLIVDGRLTVVNPFADDESAAERAGPKRI